MNKYIVQISTWLAVLLTVGCNPKHTSNYSKKSNKKVNAYTKKHDSHPLHHDIPDLTLVREPEPKHEPKSRYGNPAKYTVLNKTYSVLTSSKGYKERGYASWYGTKFHGFRTSSGEQRVFQGAPSARCQLGSHLLYLPAQRLDQGL